MKALVVAACICVIGATIAGGAFIYIQHQKAEARDMMSKCRALANTDPQILNEFERAQAKILADKCVAHIRS